MSYQVENGLINSEACQLNVVDHCNIFCRSCTNLSPAFNERHMDPSEAYEALCILAKYYKAERFRLTGGEPLLHNDLLALVESVQKSNISSRIYIQTNGILLAKMPDDLWSALDDVIVSQREDKKITPQSLKLIQEKAELHNVNLEFYSYSDFVESYSELETSDETLVKRIYDVCTIKYTYHTVMEGHFYKCPRSYFLPKMLGIDSSRLNVDGIKIIDSPSFRDDLLAYLESPTPLYSCRFCLGNVGQMRPYEDVRRKIWRDFQQKPAEEMIDWKRLTLFEKIAAKRGNNKKQALLSAARLSAVSFRHFSDME